MDANPFIYKFQVPINIFIEVFKGVIREEICIPGLSLKKTLHVSLCPERQAIALAHASKFVRANKCYKHCIICAKIVFPIIFLIMKILIIFNQNLHNKNLHDNRLYNGLETQVHFLEISLKLKYFWNITRGITRE